MKNIKKIILIIVLIFTVNTIIIANEKGVDVEYLETTYDESLKLEDWMFNPYLWNFEYLIQEDEIFKIEDWMINNYYWNSDNYIIEESENEELKIEDWMIKSEFFN